MQDKKPDVPVSDESNLVIVTTPEYVKDSIKEAIAEHAASRNHPDATLQDKGFVVLSNDVGSDSETMAATSKAVKAAYDLANTANQNALNNNTNLYLEKKQNGADIPDKAAFVDNLDFMGRVIRNDLFSTQEVKNPFLVVGESACHNNSGVFINLKTAEGFPELVYKWSDTQWYELKVPAGSGTVLSLGANCIVGPNGYIIPSSPSIQIYSSGKFTASDESKGITADRLSKGTYIIKGAMGFNTDEAIDNIEIPLCQNKLPLVWVNHEVLLDGSIKLMTYHREHLDAPAFARNIRKGYSDGDLIDIPEGRFVSVRVQMPDTK